jgi:hypothetical protein
MKKLMVLLLLTSPLTLTLATVILPKLCLVLFLIFPPLVLLCVGPFAGVLPADFQTFL